MRVDDVIVVATGSSQGDPATAGPRLERGIRRLIAQGRKPTVVIGPDGESLLANCPALEECELAFCSSDAASPESAIELALEAGSGGAIAFELAGLDFGIERLRELDELAFSRLGADALEVTTGEAASERTAVAAWIVTLPGSKKLRNRGRGGERRPRADERRPSGPDDLALRPQSWRDRDRFALETLRLDPRTKSQTAA